MMSPDQLPPPDTLIEYRDGVVGALMFHYATELDDLKLIAQNQGFDVAIMEMRDDLGDTHELVLAYDNGASADDVLPKWIPEPRVGWCLAAKHDTEDGPVAIFVRRKQQAIVGPASAYQIVGLDLAAPGSERTAVRCGCGHDTSWPAGEELPNNCGGCGRPFSWLGLNGGTHGSEPR